MKFLYFSQGYFSQGYFAKRLSVYGREGKSRVTPGCKSSIAQVTLGQRDSFFCPSCQRKLGLSLDILIIGGEVDAKLMAEYTGQRTTFVSYCAVIALAKTQLEWLINELSTSK